MDELRVMECASTCCFVKASARHAVFSSSPEQREQQVRGWLFFHQEDDRDVRFTRSPCACLFSPQAPRPGCAQGGGWLALLTHRPGCSSGRPGSRETDRMA